MARATHRIRRLRWQVRNRSTAEAFTTRKLLRDRWEEWLVPVLENAFDEIAGGDRLIHIPKLELRISVPSEEQLPEKLPDLIRDQLDEQLRSLGRQAAPAEGRSAGTEAGTGESRFQGLLHYLRTGSASWLFAHAPASDIAAELGDICRTQWFSLAQHLRTRPESHEFYFRLVQLISEERLSARLNEVLELGSQASDEALSHAITRLLEESAGELTRYERLAAAAALIAEALSGRRALPDVLAAIGKILPGERLAAFRSALSTLPDSAALFTEERSGGSDGPEQAAGSSFATEGRPPAVPLNNEGEAPLSRDASEHRTAPVLPERSFGKTAAKDEFPLMANHVGLAILHPFIPRLFENTGLREAGGAELAFHVLPRAAALLHYLATGRETVYEYELGFIKILLGLHPETPLPVAEGLIEPRDREETETLLQSVIGYWQVLKNTSIQGLRSSFLERSGLIREEESGWRLQVESRPFDMLLDQLPWSIGIVKSPWMTKPVYVEWQAS